MHVVKTLIYDLDVSYAPTYIFGCNGYPNYNLILTRRVNRSKVVYKASCWDCDDCCVGITKRRLHDRKTEHFRALTEHFRAILMPLLII